MQFSVSDMGEAGKSLPSLSIEANASRRSSPSKSSQGLRRSQSDDELFFDNIQLRRESGKEGTPERETAVPDEECIIANRIIDAYDYYKQNSSETFISHPLTPKRSSGRSPIVKKKLFSRLQMIAVCCNGIRRVKD